MFSTTEGEDVTNGKGKPRPNPVHTFRKPAMDYKGSTMDWARTIGCNAECSNDLKPLKGTLP